jgi:hypothetical protein
MTLWMTSRPRLSKGFWNGRRFIPVASFFPPLISISRLNTHLRGNHDPHLTQLKMCPRPPILSHIYTITQHSPLTTNLQNQHPYPQCQHTPPTCQTVSSPNRLRLLLQNHLSPNASVCTINPPSVPSPVSAGSTSSPNSYAPAPRSCSTSSSRR